GGGGGLDDPVAGLGQLPAQAGTIGAGALGADQHRVHLPRGPPPDPVDSPGQPRRAGREGALVDQGTVGTQNGQGMGGGMGIDPDHVLVALGHRDRHTSHGDVLLTYPGMDVVVGVGPGRESLRGSPVTGHNPKGLDMLLGKPPWGTRVGADTLPGGHIATTTPHTPRGSERSRVTPGQVTTPTLPGQSQTSHPKHLQNARRLGPPAALRTTDSACTGGADRYTPAEPARP